MGGVVMSLCFPSSGCLSRASGKEGEKGQEAKRPITNGKKGIRKEKKKKSVAP